MPTFQRNLTQEYHLPYKALDTVVENYLAEIIQTGNIETELEDSAVRKADADVDLVGLTADNSSNKARLLITYAMDEGNPLNILPSRLTNNVIQAWWIAYLISFKYDTTGERMEYDEYTIKTAQQLVERYCTNNDLATFTSGKRQADGYFEFTSTDGTTYKLHPYSSRRIPNVNDGNVYDDINQTNFLRSQMSILFRITI